MADKKLSYRLDCQIRIYAKRLAYLTNSSLEQDYIQDMLLLWWESSIEDNEALLWTSIKYGMYDIVFQSRKYKYSVSNIVFLSYEQLMEEMGRNDTKRDGCYSRLNLFFKQDLNSLLICQSDSENIVILNELLSFLSAKEKISLILSCGYGYTGVEIGELLGLSRSMISRYKRGALKKLQKKLKEREGISN